MGQSLAICLQIYYNILKINIEVHTYMTIKKVQTHINKYQSNRKKNKIKEQIKNLDADKFTLLQLVLTVELLRKLKENPEENKEKIIKYEKEYKEIISKIEKIKNNSQPAIEVSVVAE